MRHSTLLLIGFFLFCLLHVPAVFASDAGPAHPAHLPTVAQSVSVQKTQPAKRLGARILPRVQRPFKRKAIDPNLRNGITFGIIFVILISAVTVGGGFWVGFIVAIAALVFFVLSLVQLIKWMRTEGKL